VFDEVGIARVVEHRGELLRQADAFVELPQRQQVGVGGERTSETWAWMGRPSKKSKLKSVAGRKRTVNSVVPNRILWGLVGKP
jgi:hypothetical protein